MTTHLPETPPIWLALLLADLRACQARPELAEQRHQFLDLDPHLVRDDYTHPASSEVGVGGGEVEP